METCKKPLGSIPRIVAISTALANAVKALHPDTDLNSIPDGIKLVESVKRGHEWFTIDDIVKLSILSKHPLPRAYKFSFFARLLYSSRREYTWNSVSRFGWCTPLSSKDANNASIAFLLAMIGLLSSFLASSEGVVASLSWDWMESTFAADCSVCSMASS